MSSDGPRIAGVIRVERRGKIARLFLDGVEFPFHLALEPVEVGPIVADEMPTVRFTVLADRVDVINQFDPDPDKEKHP